MLFLCAVDAVSDAILPSQVEEGVLEMLHSVQQEVFGGYSTLPENRDSYRIDAHDGVDGI